MYCNNKNCFYNDCNDFCTIKSYVVINEYGYCEKCWPLIGTKKEVESNGSTQI